MKLCNKALLALAAAAVLATGAQTASAASFEGEASNASGANDTYATAEAYAIGNDMSGYIGTYTDVDVFAFTAQNSLYAELFLETAGNYSFTVTNPSTGEHYTDNGTGLIDMPLTYGETYYVRVFGLNDKGKEYRLSSFHYFL
ncbi:hypothetical protein CIG75_15430 [Tumebacillus algifaecis]|uniref:Peptidase C-terminal archaeal/bacterial domain-containing protein n=1 Tax=Tumebacillus algifaecis TaxID=1214604 RepID=A0A223D4A9_9BACL|nr:hypothetical protein [Tumebacillus algifaecis]ASS76194.1 hypothetical protein CIG75_15430 [Tumebacillus algifaecis]